MPPITVSGDRSDEYVVIEERVDTVRPGGDEESRSQSETEVGPATDPLLLLVPFRINRGLGTLAVATRAGCHDLSITLLIDTLTSALEPTPGLPR